MGRQLGHSTSAQLRQILQSTALIIFDENSCHTRVADRSRSEFNNFRANCGRLYTTLPSGNRLRPETTITGEHALQTPPSLQLQVLVVLHIANQLMPMPRTDTMTAAPAASQDPRPDASPPISSGDPIDSTLQTPNSLPPSPSNEESPSGTAREYANGTTFVEMQNPHSEVGEQAVGQGGQFQSIHFACFLTDIWPRLSTPRRLVQMSGSMFCGPRASS